MGVFNILWLECCIITNPSFSVINHTPDTKKGNWRLLHFLNCVLNIIEEINSETIFIYVDQKILDNSHCISVISKNEGGK